MNTYIVELRLPLNCYRLAFKVKHAATEEQAIALAKAAWWDHHDVLLISEYDGEIQLSGVETFEDEPTEEEIEEYTMRDMNVVGLEKP